MLNILIANGVNLDLLGSRPENIYGSKTLKNLEDFLEDEKIFLEKIFEKKIHLIFFQSNNECAFLEKLSEQKWDGAVLNPAAWTHTSLALADRLEALQLKFVEVHLSQLAKRESFRHHSYSAKYALGVIYGFAFDSYALGLQALLRHISHH